MAEDPPPLIYFNGAVIPWADAKIHVWTEAAIRAVNVFEGIRAYWDDRKRQWLLVQWDRHVRRLMESALIMRLPHPYEVSDLNEGVGDLLRALPYREHMYIRPTIYIEQGRAGYRLADVVTGIYIVSFPSKPADPAPQCLRCCVSTWRRSADLVSPPRVKAGASYQQFRLPRIEASQNGFDDAILMNARDTIAELTGAAILIVRDGRIITPPVFAGIIESITREIVIHLLREELKLEVIEREIERSELYVADEIMACGTLQEIAAVTEVDRVAIGSGQPGPVTRQIVDRYRSIVTGNAPDLYGWLASISSGDAASH